MKLSPRIAFALIAVTASALVIAGLVIGEWLRINPYPLCIFQRVLYLAVAAFAILGVVLPGARRLWAILIALSAAGGLATALYQTWMQLYPEQGTQCGYGEPNLIERLVDWLGMQWSYMFMATGFCSTRENILGLSIANWSILCFAMLLGAGMWTSKTLPPNR
ncbi:MAG: disulfide bond formation protein DsbB [Rhodocyclaceae bacterium]|nr:MAG: disulfide bond formation protein DsbB [Rhodocyclaceae bacterium]